MRNVVLPFVRSAYATRMRGVGCSSEKLPAPLNPPKKSASSVALARHPFPMDGPRNPNVRRVLRTSPPCHKPTSSSWTNSACWPLPRPKRASWAKSVALTNPPIVRVASLPTRTSRCPSTALAGRHTSTSAHVDRYDHEFGPIDTPRRRVMAPKHVLDAKHRGAANDAPARRMPAGTVLRTADARSDLLRRREMGGDHWTHGAL